MLKNRHVRAVVFAWESSCVSVRDRLIPRTMGTAVPGQGSSRGADMCGMPLAYCEMGRWVLTGRTLGGRRRVSAWASCGSAVVCVQPGHAAPTALGAPAAQGACRVLPNLYLWKSLIEMQVIKSNVSCSIHFHCTTTFTSPILSDISAAPLSVFFPCKSNAHSVSSLWAWQRR